MVNTKTQKIQASFVKEDITSNDQQAFSLYEKSRLGEKIYGGGSEKGDIKIKYSFPEALYLVKKGKMKIYSGRSLNQSLDFKSLYKKIQVLDKKIQIKFPVFQDLREKGYIVKTALKFGAEFRVYEKGSKPGQGHAKWIVFTDHETKRFSWHDFAAKNRVAHSTKKRLLLAIVDEEMDVSYYEVKWLKP